jgi:hypothetical protein
MLQMVDIVKFTTQHGSNTMKTAPRSPRADRIRKAVGTIQTRWSTTEREERCRVAEQRQRELYEALFGELPSAIRAGAA